MPKYVFYLRAQEGNIERLGNIIVNRPDGALLGSYEHEEPLIDFPETIVFWASKVGPSMGIAPLDPLPKKNPLD
ncbi:hypothetical protein C8R32_12335 [Nitrosospira sp. Nsp5]|uniref:Uncharacterized protein n=1 Tax=Nitrosospira multiformis TaxID=1231 RepID=A0ABY0TDD5_9PROT|nr:MULTISPECIES: hypothetical protein [Nitrosospira]PTR05371.1 hypothetical protein C8R32_12335 [Nitrosospira sp. Nsp5]SDQ66087.1 hypothetical protein SAMN05216402_1744 [Nitrosospira multiformis]